MNEKRTDPRRNAAFQRGFSGHPPRTDAGSGREAPLPSATDNAAAAEDATTSAEVAMSDELELEHEHRTFLLWTIALFVVGVGLCVVSFALFSDYNGGRWGSIQATRGGDWVVTDSSGSQQRTVSGFEYLLYRYFSQSSIWIGIVGLGVVVGNLFRIAPRRPRR